MDKCAFSKIIKKKLPAEIVYESESIIAFLDINPLNYEHVLVIPKSHTRGFLDISIELYDELVHIIRRITKAIVDSFQPAGCNIFSNNRNAVGRSVFHCNFHITPRYDSDDFKFISNLKKYKDGEMSICAQKIHHQIN
jgi:histidine triad (HIT) family protein